MTNYKKLSELGRHLKEGDEIKPGGREGKIRVYYIDRQSADVIWSNDDEEYVTLNEYPEFLVKAPQPTISREARDAIIREVKDCKSFYNLVDAQNSLRAMLDSMVEDE